MCIGHPYFVVTNCEGKKINPPERYNLGALYKYVSCKEMSSGHRSLVDVQHMIPILKYGVFWYNKDNCISKVGLNGKVKKNLKTKKYGMKEQQPLHCCPREPPMTAEYNPAYKIQEILDILQKKYDWLFVPGQQLSLDESLVCAFGRIKLKVRKVTIAARY